MLTRNDWGPIEAAIADCRLASRLPEAERCSEPDDIRQEAAHRLARRVDNGRDISAGHFAKMIGFAIADERRTRARRLIEKQVPLTHFKDPINRAQRTELELDVNNALRRLTPADAELVCARYFSGVPLKAIAERRGVKVTTIRQQACRARKQLKEVLAGYDPCGSQEG